MSDRMRFLPVSRADMEERGIDQLDFVYVIGDAYVDHPSFGPAIISRLLESHGYQVGIIAQPDWKNPDSIRALGISVMRKVSWHWESHGLDFLSAPVIWIPW